MLLASGAWTNGVRGIRGVGSPTKVDFWSVLAYTAWTNQLRGVFGVVLGLGLCVLA